MSPGANPGNIQKISYKINNSLYRRFKLKQAYEIIKMAKKKFGNLAIAFAGGKDSLVTLHIALKVDPEAVVIFNNTTVEFPETIYYVRKIAKQWNFKLYITKPKEPFFKKVKELGWASHDNRWCCRFCKDDPTFKLLSRLGIVAEITGTKRTDSMYRRYLKPIMPPSKEPYILRINPIYDWNEHEIWDYIKSHDLPYNPLYDKGYRRVGCWCCPLNGVMHYNRLKKTHPQLYKFLEQYRPLHPIFKVSNKE